MSQAAPTAFARLQALEQREAGRYDPVRFRFLQAMTRRAQDYDGEAGRVLEARLDSLLTAFEQTLTQQEKASESAGNAKAASPASATASEAKVADGLAALLASIPDRVADQDAARAETGLAVRADYPELGMLDAAQETWLRVNTNRQLRDSEQRVPDNAGPLNSSHLVHRALMLMKSQSPEYLRLFLSYANALAWLEQMSDGSAGAADSTRSGAAKKPARNKKR